MEEDNNKQVLSEWIPIPLPSPEEMLAIREECVRRREEARERAGFMLKVLKAQKEAQS